MKLKICLAVAALVMTSSVVFRSIPCHDLTWSPCKPGITILNDGSAPPMDNEF